MRWNFSWKDYGLQEWRCAQWCILPLVFLIYLDALFLSVREEFNGIIVNACAWLPCNWIELKLTKYVLIVLFLVGAVFYFGKRWAVYGCLLLALCSFIVFSYYESFGMRGEYGLFVLLFLVQAVAYYRQKDSSSYKEHFQFSLQIIAAAYILAGISKIVESGVVWFNEEAINFVLQSYHATYEKYSTYGVLAEHQRAEYIFNWMVENLYFTKFLLFLSIALEIFSFVLVLGKKRAMYYGVLLIGFHIGIFIAFRLVLFTIVISMIVLVFNPVYWIAKGFIKLKQAV